MEEDRELAKIAQKGLRVKSQAMRNLGKAKLPRVKRELRVKLPTVH